MKRLHRAWAICLGCTLMLFVCGGLSVNAFSVTQPYVLAYGGFTNTQTSMINTIRALSYLGCMFAAPLFFRTLGYRLGTAVAVAFSAVSFAVFAASKTLAGFYLGGVLAGIGYGFGSMIPATILINRWFHRKKGLAIGLCSASTGLAMIVFSPILTAICETRGLQACFLVEAVFSLVCAVLVFLLIRESPEKLSLSAYGAEDGCAAGYTAHAPPAQAAPAALAGGGSARRGRLSGSDAPHDPVYDRWHGRTCGGAGRVAVRRGSDGRQMRLRHGV